MDRATINNILRVIFTLFFIIHLFIRQFTTLIGWNTGNHSIQFSLNEICWAHHFFYFLQGCWDFPYRSFYYHPPYFIKIWKNFYLPLLLRKKVLVKYCACFNSLHSDVMFLLFASLFARGMNSALCMYVFKI